MGPQLIILFSGIILDLIGIIFLLTEYHSIYIILGPNSLKVVKKALCRNKTIIYNAGELERFEFNFESSFATDSDDDTFEIQYYNLKLVQTKGKKDFIMSIAENKITKEEMDYFSNYINNHIQTKMKMSELN